MVDRERSHHPSRKWQNLVIITFLALVTIDSFPSEGRVIKALQRAIDPIMDFTGLWQESWGLYAPDVERHNVWVEARLYVEGQSDFIEWRSPHWRSLNCFEKFTKSREIEFYDRVRFDSSAPAHASFARYLIREYQGMQPDDTVMKIELISVTEETPPPEKAGTKPKTKRILFFTLKQ